MSDGMTLDRIREAMVKCEELISLLERTEYEDDEGMFPITDHIRDAKSDLEDWLAMEELNKLRQRAYLVREESK